MLFANFPPAHTTHADKAEPSFGLLVPTGQSKQTASEAAEGEELYLPLRHDVQNDAPDGEK